MKQKLLAVCCAAVLTAGFLSGCGDSKTEEKTEITEEKENTKDTEAPSEKDTSDDTEKVVGEKEAEAAGFSDGEEGEEAGPEETGEGEADAEKTGSDDEVEVILDVSAPLSGKHHVEIEVKDYGTIEMELDADTAPVTVTNFVKLVQEDFYDGLTFHRVVDGFVIQGGDPLGNGTGGSGETIKGEFSNNGVKNDISHVRGTVSMARGSSADSASSQFFIVQADSTYLDGDYAGFGKVTEGMDVVDAICKNVEPTDSGGLVKAEEQPVIESIKIID